MIDTNALTLFKKHENMSADERLTATSEQPVSTSKEDKLTQALERQISMLSSQLSEVTASLKAEREDNRSLTNQLIVLSTDFSELAKQSNLLASQSQSLQGHIQRRTLGEVDAQVDGVDATACDVDKVDTPKKKGLFSRIFK